MVNAIKTTAGIWKCSKCFKMNGSRIRADLCCEEKKYTFTIHGNSNEDVYCKHCQKPFAWLEARQVELGQFRAICAPCRKLMAKTLKQLNLKGRK